MNPSSNRQFRLAARPVGLPKPGDWNLTEEPVPTPGDGEFLVRSHYISLDPAMRGWMDDRKSYSAPVAIGAVMRAGAVGEVIASHHPAFTVGSHVFGAFGVQDYAVSDGKGVNLVDARVAPLSLYLGTLGISGLTAYFGLLDVGEAKAGDTVVVSAAAGAAGSAAGQIAKIKGCRVIGIARGADKCRYLVEDLGFDAAIDYKAEDVGQMLKQHCPQGINVYFDNVGGEILEAALSRLAMHARVVLCGAISQYNNLAKPQGPRNYLNLLVSRARMEGFLIFDYAGRYHEALPHLGAWVQEGKLKSREDVVEGLEHFPDALIRLFTGENTGKVVLKIV